MIGEREVTVFYDERMLAHRPDAEDPFLPGRLDRRVREILSGLGVKWDYPEHPGRLTAIRELLEREPVPGVKFEPGTPATREQLSRVHTTSYLDAIYKLRGQNAWLDVDTTAVSAGSVEAAEVAAGTAIAAVEAVVAGRTGLGLRPGASARSPRRARAGARFLPVQQRGRGGGPCPKRAGLPAGADRGLGRPPRQRHPGNLLGRSGRHAVRYPPGGAVLSRIGPA